MTNREPGLPSAYKAGAAREVWTYGSPAWLKANSKRNRAFVFIKPHAVTEAVKAEVHSTLQRCGCAVLQEGSIASETIDKDKLIDQHYYAIASKATILKPKDLNVDNKKFKDQFGLDWKDVLGSGKAYNALDGCAKLGLTPDEMDAQWGICKKSKKLVKLGGGFYCGLIEIKGKESIYVFNGFFMSMRNKFTAPGLSIYYYVVEWDPSAFTWADFRGKVLGPTDPAEAPADSLRGVIMKQWKKLGLAYEPNVGDNGVHASASPFEAFAERNNWLKVPIREDPFGQQMLDAGIAQAWIEEGTVDPQVDLGDSKGSLFDSVEDFDTGACLDKLKSLAALAGQLGAPVGGLGASGSAGAASVEGIRALAAGLLQNLENSTTSSSSTVATERAMRLVLRLIAGESVGTATIVPPKKAQPAPAAAKAAKQKGAKEASATSAKSTVGKQAPGAAAPGPSGAKLWEGSSAADVAAQLAATRGQRTPEMTAKVVAALSEYGSDEEVAWQAFSAITGIMCKADDKTAPGVSKALVDAGAVHVALAALDAHGSSRIVVAQVLLALRKMFVTDGNKLHSFVAKLDTKKLKAALAKAGKGDPDAAVLVSLL